MKPDAASTCLYRHNNGDKPCAEITLNYTSTKLFIPELFLAMCTIILLDVNLWQVFNELKISVQQYIIMFQHKMIWRIS